MAGVHTMPKRTQREMRRERRRNARGGRPTLADKVRAAASQWRSLVPVAPSQPADEVPLTGAEAGLAAVNAIHERYPELPRLDWRYAGVNPNFGREQVVGLVDPSLDYGYQRELVTLFAAVLGAEQKSRTAPDGPYSDLWATNVYGGVLVTVRACVPAHQPASDLAAEPPIPMVEVPDEVEPMPIELEIEADGGPPTEVFQAIVIDGSDSGSVAEATAEPETLPADLAEIAAACAREVSV